MTDSKEYTSQKHVEDYMSSSGSVLAARVWSSVHEPSKLISDALGISYEEAEQLLLDRFILELKG